MIYLILLIIIVIIFFFSSKKLSPIPYFPSQPVDLPKIIKALGLKNEQTVFDLGAGDGIVIFSAAQEAYKRKLNTQFIAVEINPVLIFILFLRRFFHLNKKNVKIIYGDIFTMDFVNFTKLVTVYLYISPWFLEKVFFNIKHLSSNISIVSYMYPIKSLKTKQKIIQGKNKIFIYQTR